MPIISSGHEPSTGKEGCVLLILNPRLPAILTQKMPRVVVRTHVGDIVKSETICIDLLGYILC